MQVLVTASWERNSHSGSVPSSECVRQDSKTVETADLLQGSIQSANTSPQLGLHSCAQSPWSQAQLHTASHPPPSTTSASPEPHSTLKHRLSSGRHKLNRPFCGLKTKMPQAEINFPTQSWEGNLFSPSFFHCPYRAARKICFNS